MNKIVKLLFVFVTLSVNSQETDTKLEINKVVDAWHKAAAESDFDTYFGLMMKEGVFIGTDATENWQNKAFRAYSKPHFDAGKAWNFTALERNIYINSEENVAWFDELLDTQMKICRGSGVLQKIDGNWKIAHYVLSLTIPNEKVAEVVLLKKESDSVTLASKRN